MLPWSKANWFYYGHFTLQEVRICTGVLADRCVVACFNFILYKSSFSVWSLGLLLGLWREGLLISSADLPNYFSKLTLEKGGAFVKHGYIYRSLLGIRFLSLSVSLCTGCEGNKPTSFKATHATKMSYVNVNFLDSSWVKTHSVLERQGFKR
jgi:hypothetical protein